MITLATTRVTRTYRHGLADLSVARHHLAHDLTRLLHLAAAPAPAPAGSPTLAPAPDQPVPEAIDPGLLDPDLLDTLRLCHHELHANACKYGHPRTPVIRHLTRARNGDLTLTLHNQHPPGLRTTVPRVPTERTAAQWHTAEGQRGLLLVTRLATAWGHYTWPARARLGTLVWATFAPTRP